MNDLNQKEVTIYMIPRHDIEAGNIKPLLSRLQMSEGSYDAPFHLVIDGYNNDDRELYEIPEVTRFFKRLCKRFIAWLRPSISLDTIRLVIQILLTKKTERPDGDIGKTIRHIYLKEGDWSKLIRDWARKSPLGLDYGSHLAFEAFPTMCKVEGFETRDQGLNLLRKMIETGYPISQSLLKTGKGAVKVYAFAAGTVELRLYHKKGHNNVTDKLILELPDLESEESTLLFKDRFQAWIETVTHT